MAQSSSNNFLIDKKCLPLIAYESFVYLCFLKILISRLTPFFHSPIQLYNAVNMLTDRKFRVCIRGTIKPIPTPRLSVLSNVILLLEENVVLTVNGINTNLMSHGD